ncbi:hypothetical protein F0562_018798 [Nyssa sinensis]|uniref:Uncharacterized protein n=1 Tax=Nyssa sinensis TaxID=561372 RepID=A0A5J4ZE58_9ASTE|nr:hypothetical protein F0562_018798 [Nyssa sinensis]
MEHDGQPYPAPFRIRSHPQLFNKDLGPEMGPTSSRLEHICGLRPNARAHFLLLGPRVAHVGDHVVLSAPRRVFDGRDRNQESSKGQVSDASNNHWPFHRSICYGYRILAVLATVVTVRGEAKTVGEEFRLMLAMGLASSVVVVDEDLRMRWWAISVEAKVTFRPLEIR